MITELPYQPTWEIFDSTKANQYMKCPRETFFEHVLGWRPSVPQHNLSFGRAFHEGLEYIYEDRKKNNLTSYRDVDVAKATKIFLDDYRKDFGPESDWEHGNKNPENVARIYDEYLRKYASDNFETVWTEISGSVPIGVKSDGSDKEMHFRLDTVIRDERGLSILEHKTSAWSVFFWETSWEGSVQAGCGVHALYCYFNEPIYGVIMNGLFFRAPRLEKEDGSAYARKNNTGNQFSRLPIVPGPGQQEAWLSMMNTHFDRYHDDLDRLDSAEKGDVVLDAFPKNPNNCIRYGSVCPFHSYCHNWANPLQHLDEMPPEFKVDFWDPRKQDKEYTGKCDEGKVIDV